MVWTDPGSRKYCQRCTNPRWGQHLPTRHDAGITERGVVGIVTGLTAAGDKSTTWRMLAAATEPMAMPPVNPVSGTSVR